jgi:hypothetical protein
LIISYIQKHGIKEISFRDEDCYYLKIWHKDRNLENKCPRYTMGYFDEDIEALKEILEGKYVFSSYDLERIGAILTGFGAT